MVIDGSVKLLPYCGRTLRRRHTVVANVEIQRTQGFTVETYKCTGATVSATAGVARWYRRKRPAYLNIDDCYRCELALRFTRLAVTRRISCSVREHPPSMHAKSVTAQVVPADMRAAGRPFLAPSFWLAPNAR